jgi:sec-independent protein translocase protein TatA
MGEFSLSHIIFVLLVVLVIFGPSKLPGLGKGMGEAIRGFKKGLTEDKPDAVDVNAQLREPAAPRYDSARETARPADVRRDSEIHPS